MIRTGDFCTLELDSQSGHLLYMNFKIITSELEYMKLLRNKCMMNVK